MGHYLLAPRIVSADCTAPHYRTIRDFSNPETGSMNLSLLPGDMTLAKLVCVSQELKKRHRNWIRASFLFFDSDDAARRFEGSGLNTERGDFRGDLRAVYSFETTPHREDLMVTPFGSRMPGQYDTIIAIPVVATPHCRLEVAGRCVMAMEPPSYPAEALTDSRSGEITLIGTISRLGRVTASVVSAGDRQPARNNSLTRAAVENLRTWRLEPNPRQHTFRISYAYAIDPSLERDQVELKFALPDRVTIRANPRKRD
jgi:TonB family protein